MREVIAAAGQMTGRQITVRRGARRAGDPPVLVADSSRAKCELGWKPGRAALDVQIADAWRWHQRHFQN